jgi:hypothetical protein
MKLILGRLRICEEAMNVVLQSNTFLMLLPCRCASTIGPPWVRMFWLRPAAQPYNLPTRSLRLRLVQDKNEESRGDR